MIWLHGLGADGFDFVPIVDELRLPATLPVRFIFPHAASRPVTINNGYVMRAWYDIKGFGPERAEDDAGIRESEGVVKRYIEQQIAQGIPASKIVIAGFSQGGAIALQTALRYPQRLAGVMALSTYLPLAGSLPAEASAANRDVPILMCTVCTIRSCRCRWARRRATRYRASAIASSGAPIRWSIQFAWKRWSTSRNGCRRAWPEEQSPVL